MSQCFVVIIFIIPVSNSREDVHNAQQAHRARKLQLISDRRKKPLHIPAVRAITCTAGLEATSTVNIQPSVYEFIKRRLLVPLQLPGGHNLWKTLLHAEVDTWWMGSSDSDLAKCYGGAAAQSLTNLVDMLAQEHPLVLPDARAMEHKLLTTSGIILERADTGSSFAHPIVIEDIVRSSTKRKLRVWESAGGIRRVQRARKKRKLEGFLSFDHPLVKAAFENRCQ